ncbi:MAG: lipocalin-like domain-containing protein [Chromatiales bacterium]
MTDRFAHKAWPLIIAASLAGCLSGCDEPAAPTTVPVTRLLGAAGLDHGYARAEQLREFRFPADHGAHPRFRSEWWYFTGNLRTGDGRLFGYQLTFFRFALSPHPVTSARSSWRSNELYLAHFALTDIEGRRFHAFERSSRTALEIAGASAEPFAVWLDNWSARSDAGAFAPRLRAAAEDARIDLQLSPGKPVVLQGDRGLSRKGVRPGDASYYYSLTRMPTSGTVTLAGRVFHVEGASWMDREWSTSALEPEQVGWDWFALQFEDGRDLMFYRLRRRDGSVDPHSAGVLVGADGSTTPVSHNAVITDELSTWRSSRSGVRYPARWRLRVPSADLDVEIQPLLADQELDLSVRYWEGAIRFVGAGNGKSVAGVGYAELVGYATSR